MKKRFVYELEYWVTGRVPVTVVATSEEEAEKMAQEELKGKYFGDLRYTTIETQPWSVSSDIYTED